MLIPKPKKQIKNLNKYHKISLESSERKKSQQQSLFYSSKAITCLSRLALWAPDMQ